MPQSNSSISCAAIFSSRVFLDTICGTPRSRKADSPPRSKKAVGLYAVLECQYDLTQWKRLRFAEKAKIRVGVAFSGISPRAVADAIVEVMKPQPPGPAPS